MNKYIGIPFVDRGRSLEGCDCWGLVKLIYQEEYGIELPDFNISAFDIHGVAMQMEESRKGPQWIEVDDPEEGDVVAMHVGARHMGMVNHVGVYVGGGQFIHILQKTNSMMNRMADLQWVPRIIGVYRWAN